METEWSRAERERLLRVLSAAMAPTPVRIRHIVSCSMEVAVAVNAVSTAKAASETNMTPEDQPRLVAIPDRGDCIDHDVPICATGNEGKQDTDSEIESVHDDVHHQAENDDDHPQERKIDTHGVIPPSARRV
jgi:hypothetical protein